jgi:hypothetical protein
LKLLNANLAKDALPKRLLATLCASMWEVRPLLVAELVGQLSMDAFRNFLSHWAPNAG